MPARPLDAALIDRARALAQTTHLSAEAIAARVGLSASSVRRLSRTQGWARPQMPDRARMLERLWLGAERQLATLEADAGGGRDLGALVKVLRDLVALDEGAAAAPAPPPDAAALREKIAARLVRLHGLQNGAPAAT